jgi:sarcosine oxidase subunit gamma
VSAPEPRTPAGVAFARWAAEVIEVAALRNQAAAAESFGTASGEPLPAFGQVRSTASALALCVRPARWHLVAPLPAQQESARARDWRAGVGPAAAVTELSSALAAFILCGPELGEMLARGCRLDLHPRVFPPGSAAATVMVQVPVVLAALPHGMLLLTPSSTAQHFAEWLETAARPFGRAADPTITGLWQG